MSLFPILSEEGYSLPSGSEGGGQSYSSDGRAFISPPMPGLARQPAEANRQPAHGSDPQTRAER